MRVLVGCFLRCFSGWTIDSSVRYGGLYPSRIFTVLGIYWSSLQAIPVVFWDRISMPSPSIHTCDRSFLSGLTGPLAGECHTSPWRLHPRKESPAKVTVTKKRRNQMKDLNSAEGLLSFWLCWSSEWRLLHVSSMTLPRKVLSRQEQW